MTKEDLKVDVRELGLHYVYDCPHPFTEHEGRYCLSELHQS